MKLGVCYYPEHWPEERWPVDASLMRQAGISIVRLADFAWAALEPRENEFTWSWLDKVIDILAAENLQIVLCTPTASPPAWICRAHPDILPVDSQGRRRRFGSRRHYCPNNSIYHDHTVRIVAALASRYGKHPAVAGWQIDNELGWHGTARCYCETCAEAFRIWLAKKYQNIISLNQAWGNAFWSQTCGDWSEIDLPNLTLAEPNPSHVLDYYRFASDSTVAYQQLQISTIRPLILEKQFITTNYMSRFTDLNYYDLAEPLDMVTMSSYPTGNAEMPPSLYLNSENRPAFGFDVGDPYITGFGQALMRGFKAGRPFWVMEQQAGNVNWSIFNTGIRPGTTRLWTWQALGSGAEAVLYFRWRAGLFGQEQMHSGLLHHDGSPDVGFGDLQLMANERDLMAEIVSEPYQAQIAIVYDYDTLWALQLQPHNQAFDPIRLAFTYFRSLQRLGLAVDIVSANSDLSPYKIVIVPTAFLASKEQADSLTSFARAGGTVLLGVRSGFKTVDNLVTDKPLPGIFRELAGLTVSSWHSLTPQTSYEIDSSIPMLKGPAAVWAEALDPLPPSSRHSESDFKELARYSSGPFANAAALCENRVGAGRALYLGWYPSDVQAGALLKHLADEAGIHSSADIPDGVIASKRGPFLILLNFTDETQDAVVDGKPVKVPARNVKVVKNSLS